MNKIQTSLVLIFFGLTAMAQENSVLSGKTLDQFGEPIIGAYAFFNNKKGSVSDLNGSYKITDLASGEHELNVVYINDTTLYSIKIEKDYMHKKLTIRLMPTLISCGFDCRKLELIAPGDESFFKMTQEDLKHHVYR